MAPLCTKRRIPKRSDIVKLWIVDFLNHYPRKSVKELSIELGIPQQTVHRHLQELVRKTGLIRVAVDLPDRCYRYYCKPGMDAYFAQLSRLVDGLGTIFLETEN